MQRTNNFWDCLKQHEWCMTGPRLNRMASEPCWNLPDAAEQKALGSSMKEEPCRPSHGEKGCFFFLLYCQIIRLQKISHFIPGMRWMHLKGKQESLQLSSSCTAGHCDVSPRCNQGQGWVRERWAPECSRRPQFSSRLYKPFQFKFWLVKLGFFPIKIIFIGSTERTFWNSGRKFPIGYSKQECKQKVMKTMQGITMAFRYLWNNKKTTFYVLHYSKIDTQGPI